MVHVLLKWSNRERVCDVTSPGISFNNDSASRVSGILLVESAFRDKIGASLDTV